MLLVEEGLVTAAQWNLANAIQDQENLNRQIAHCLQVR
jgi:hypothetical protein